jgi:two-component system, chemotaxis family, sensor histidine kinase and response regulator WspE
MSAEDLGELSMLDLFRMEAESQAEVLTAGLLALERDSSSAEQLELCMRAAHSLKGAARVVGLDAGVRVAHAMEDCFVAAQEARVTLKQKDIDRLLMATDLLVRIGDTPDAPGVEECLTELARVLEVEPIVEVPDLPDLPIVPAPVAELVAEPVAPVQQPAPVAGARRDNSDRVLRVSAENLNRLLGLAGESLVESRSVKPFADALLRLKRMQQHLAATLDGLRHLSPSPTRDEQMRNGLELAQQSAQKCQQFLSERLDDLELFDRRSINLAHRLYDGALACRMRPFADGIVGFPRMVREVAQALGKQVRLEITGEATQVDRDVLVKLDAPLGHLLRNAIDHGIETPDERRAARKPTEGVIRIDASHRVGALHISISDDGGGVNLEKTRTIVVERRLLNRDAAATLTEAELLEFLFLPGFTMKTTVTDVSGRGVGLDVVQDMVKQVRGVVRVQSQPGVGTTFRLQLPVTLSIVRTLLAEVGGEPYAFPLSSIVRTLKLPDEKIAQLEGRQHFDFDGRRIGLVTAHQVLEVAAPLAAGTELSVIVLGDQSQAYGLVVDRFIGERELVVQQLDPQLGKIRNISSAALMEDGAPVLIVDPEDMIRSMDRLVSVGGLSKVTHAAVSTGQKKRKRVLVVDDSLTVRELERKVLGNHGYEVEVAVDGMDGWNAVRMGDFDLVITDIDMPRMDGIELVKLINGDARLKTRPVMIVSYKDRDEDRRRGLEAGAAYYLTKASFHDDKLLQAVVDLIGEATA